MPTVRGALIGKPSPIRAPGPLVARVNAENSRVTNTTTPRSVELNHQETLTRRSITSRMQMPCNNDKECPDGGGGQIVRALKWLTIFARQKFQRRGVASGNNVVWKRDEQGGRMQRCSEGLGMEALGA